MTFWFLENKIATFEIYIAGEFFVLQDVLMSVEKC